MFSCQQLPQTGKNELLTTNLSLRVFAEHCFVVDNNLFKVWCDQQLYSYPYNIVGAVCEGTGEKHGSRMLVFVVHVLLAS